jgi:hypothetical protein
MVKGNVVSWQKPTDSNVATALSQLKRNPAREFGMRG